MNSSTTRSLEPRAISNTSVDNHIVILRGDAGWSVLPLLELYSTPLSTSPASAPARVISCEINLPLPECQPATQTILHACASASVLSRPPTIYSVTIVSWHSRRLTSFAILPDAVPSALTVEYQSTVCCRVGFWSKAVAAAAGLSCTMGNSQTREVGAGDSSQSRGRSRRHHEYADEGSSSDRLAAASHSSRNGRGSRTDLSFLGIGSSNPDPPLEPRRETKQEREARKLAKEHEAREKERERSMKEEHVDGGFLVTQGVYTGTEDFNKPVVRQLMVNRSEVMCFFFSANIDLV